MSGGRKGRELGEEGEEEGKGTGRKGERRGEGGRRSTRRYGEGRKVTGGKRKGRGGEGDGMASMIPIKK